MIIAMYCVIKLYYNSLKQTIIIEKTLGSIDQDLNLFCSDFTLETFVECICNPNLLNAQKVLSVRYHY